MWTFTVERHVIKEAVGNFIGCKYFIVNVEVNIYKSENDDLFRTKEKKI